MNVTPCPFDTSYKSVLITEFWKSFGVQKRSPDCPKGYPTISQFPFQLADICGPAMSNGWIDDTLSNLIFLLSCMKCKTKAKVLGITLGKILSFMTKLRSIYLFLLAI